MKALWAAEAERNLVLPLDDRTAAEILGVERPTSEPVRKRYTYYPGTAPVPEGVAVSVRGRSYKILASVTVEKPDASGVIFAHESRFGGHTMFLENGTLNYVYNFLGIKPEQRLTAPEPLAPGQYVVGMEFVREGAGEFGESLGRAKLYVDGESVAESKMRTQLGKFTLSGDGLCVGYDSGDAVSDAYESPGRFAGGEIQFVEVAVDKAQYVDVSLELKRALRD